LDFFGKFAYLQSEKQSSKMESNHEHSTGNQEKGGLFYTYFGETGAAATAFIYFLILAICIFSFLRWG